MTQGLPESELFVLLGKRRRRLMIRILQEAATPLTATELAKRIGNYEQERPSSEAEKTISVSLVHHHLSRLEKADVVEYNETGGTVRPGVNFDTLLRTLAEVDDMDLSWTDE